MKIIIGNKQGYKINGSMKFFKVDNPLPYDKTKVFEYKFYATTSGATGWSPYTTTNKIDSIWFDGELQDITQVVTYEAGYHTLAIKLLDNYKTTVEFGKFVLGSNEQSNKSKATGQNDLISISFPDNITSFPNDVAYWWGFNVVTRTGDSELYITIPSLVTSAGARFMEIFNSHTCNKPTNLILTTPTKITASYGNAPGSFFGKYSGNKIWVPNNLLSSYLADSNWTCNRSYSSRFVGYTDIVDGVPIPAV